MNKGKCHNKKANNIFIILNHYKTEHPIKFWISILGILISIFALKYTIIEYNERHTPRLEIAEASFYYQPLSFSGGNITGILVILANESRAWAKNVVVDFINNDGYKKYEKIKYYRENNYAVETKDIAPNDKITDGYFPQGPSASPTIYRNNDTKYRVDIFIDWENDKGKKYSLVAAYESIADNFSRRVRFKKIYRYDSFKDKKKVEEIKREHMNYLPEDLM